MANLKDDAPVGSWRRNTTVNLLVGTIKYGLQAWGLMAWGESQPNPKWTRTKP